MGRNECYVRESVTISLCFIVKQTQLSISGGCGSVPPLPISRVGYAVCIGHIFFILLNSFYINIYIYINKNINMNR